MTFTVRANFYVPSVNYLVGYEKMPDGKILEENLIFISLIALLFYYFLKVFGTKQVLCWAFLNGVFCLFPVCLAVEMSSLSNF